MSTIRSVHKYVPCVAPVVLLPVPASSLQRPSSPSSQSEQVVKTWASKKGDKKDKGEPLAKRLRSTFSSRMLLAWLAWALLLWWALPLSQPLLEVLPVARCWSNLLAALLPIFWQQKADRPSPPPAAAACALSGM